MKKKSLKMVKSIFNLKGGNITKFCLKWIVFDYSILSLKSERFVKNCYFFKRFLDIIKLVFSFLLFKEKTEDTLPVMIFGAKNAN